MQATPSQAVGFRFGKVAVEFPIVQAALSGYSDWPMRKIARRLGAGYGVCEVMLDQFLVTIKQRAKTRHFLYLDDEERPVGGQLMGAEPEQFSAGALKLVEAGFDVHRPEKLPVNDAAISFGQIVEALAHLSK